MDLNQNYRSLVLAVAQNSTVKNLVLTRAKGFSRRFVAGDKLEEALKAVEALEKDNIHGILDLLGEMVTDETQAQQFKNDIITLIQTFGAKPYPRYVALKLTQLGLDLSEDLTYRLMTDILIEAKKVVCFVRIDMEDSPRVDATLRIYKRLREAGFTNTGLVLQSYLKRTEKDLETLLPFKPALRIVKGAYKEPASAAFQDKTMIDAQYLVLAKKALEHDCYTAIATHDPRLIEEMKRWVKAKNLPRDKFEFQMLYGVRRDEQKKLATEGYITRAYIPYGTDWYPYFSRRIAERPENLLFVTRSLIQG
jgi:proline dehydrogenase